MHLFLSNDLELKTFTLIWYVGYDRSFIKMENNDVSVILLRKIITRKNELDAGQVISEVLK